MYFSFPWMAPQANKICRIKTNLRWPRDTINYNASKPGLTQQKDHDTTLQAEYCSDWVHAA